MVRKRGRPQKGAISGSEILAGRFAIALQASGEEGLTPLDARDAMEEGIDERTFAAVKTLAAEQGYVFWRYDWKLKRYFWLWLAGQGGALQNQKYMRTRTRRDINKYRSAADAERFEKPAPGIPYQYAGGFFGAMFQQAVAVAVVDFYLHAGTDKIALPLSEIQAEVQGVMARVLSVVS